MAAPLQAAARTTTNAREDRRDAPALRRLPPQARHCAARPRGTYAAVRFARQYGEPLRSRRCRSGVCADPNRHLADAGQLLAGEPVHVAPAAEARLQSARSGSGSSMTSPMQRRIATERMRAHRREQALALAPAGRSRPACLRWRRRAGRGRGTRTPRLTCGLTGRSRSRMTMPQPRLGRDLVERRRQPAAGRVAQAVDARNGRDHRRDEAMQRRGIRLDGRSRSDRFSRSDMIATP